MRCLYHLIIGSFVVACNLLEKNSHSKMLPSSPIVIKGGKGTNTDNPSNTLGEGTLHKTEVKEEDLKKAEKACEEGNVQVLQDMLMSGAINLQLVRKAGYPLLYYGIKGNQVEIVEFLLKNGASVYQRCGNRYFLFEVAMRRPSAYCPAIVKLLIQYGAYEASLQQDRWVERGPLMLSYKFESPETLSGKALRASLGQQDVDEIAIMEKEKPKLEVFGMLVGRGARWTGKDQGNVKEWALPCQIRAILQYRDEENKGIFDLAVAANNNVFCKQLLELVSKNNIVLKRDWELKEVLIEALRPEGEASNFSLYILDILVQYAISVAIPAKATQDYLKQHNLYPHF